MSGRKKNRKHRHGQPPHELLNELSSLHELLGSDMEADIPLLDQVAGPAAGTSSPQPQQAAPAKPAAASPTPKPQPRPLEEADLPILFSPIDEELDDEYAPALSDADRELLRPLQDLPRKPSDDAIQPELPKEAPKEAPKEPPKQKRPEPEPSKEVAAQADTKSASRQEFQPGLFDAPQKKAKPPAKPAPQESKPTSEPAAQPVKQETHADEATPSQGKAQASNSKPAPQRTGAENPFLPAHIRARLTGGRVPRSENLTPPSPKSEARTPEAQPAAAEPQAAESTDEPKEPSARDKLIEQLMAEQLPELERQLRANITALVDEIYPEQE
ncbi:hypothetical protein [Microbulbifer agarilyticus]